jgi:hypothetical protein
LACKKFKKMYCIVWSPPSCPHTTRTFLQVILAQDGVDQTIQYIFMKFLHANEFGKTKACEKFQPLIFLQKLVIAPQIGVRFALPKHTTT